MFNPRLSGFVSSIAGACCLLIGASSSSAQTITQFVRPLNGPERIAVDGSGNVYVTGAGSYNAFKITPAGVVTEIIDSTGDGENPLDLLYGIAVDGSGNIYVVGIWSHNAFKITPGGVITEIIDATGDGAKRLHRPYSIAVDAAGNVYVAGFNSDNAFKITPGGVITQIIDATGDGACNAPDNVARGIAVDAAGNVYVAGGSKSSSNYGAFKITPAGRHHSKSSTRQVTGARNWIGRTASPWTARVMST